MHRRYAALAAVAIAGSIVTMTPAGAGAAEGNGAASASKTIVVRGTNAAFASPTGNIVCLMYGTR